MPSKNMAEILPPRVNIFLESLKQMDEQKYTNIVLALVMVSFYITLKNKLKVSCAQLVACFKLGLAKSAASHVITTARVLQQFLCVLHNLSCLFGFCSSL